MRSDLVQPRLGGARSWRRAWLSAVAALGLTLTGPPAFAQGAFWLPIDLGRNSSGVVAAVGDSITLGTTCGSGNTCSQVARPYPAGLQGLLSDSELVVLNRGVGGETTVGGLGRIDDVVDADRPAIVLIMEGINDATFDFPSASVIDNLRQMVRAVKVRKSIPILGAITPNFRDAPAAQAIIDEVNAALPAVAAAEGVRFVDTFSALNDGSLYSQDLLHPTQQGYDVLAAAWRPAVADALADLGTLLKGVPVAGAHLGGLPTDRHVVTGTGQGPSARVRTFGIDESAFGPAVIPYDPDYRSGVRVAACDFDGDGRDEIVVAKGPGAKARVRVFQLDAAGAPVATLADFIAFDPSFHGGAFVACGDLDGDGIPEIVVAAGPGGLPEVRAFRLAANQPGGVVEAGVNFLAYSASSEAGVSVAVADLDGDGKLEIVTARGGGGGRVRAFRYAPGKPGGVEATGLDFFPYDPGFGRGAFVAAGDLDGDGRAEIVTGAGPGGSPRVRVFQQAPDLTVTELGNFLPYAESFHGGVFVGVTGSTVLTGKGHGNARVRGFAADGTPTAIDFFAY